MLVMMAAPLTGSSLHAQQTREQAMIFGEEPVLDPMRKTLKAEVLVLRGNRGSGGLRET